MAKIDEILDSYAMYTLRGGYWADKKEVKKNTAQAKQALYTDMYEIISFSADRADAYKQLKEYYGISDEDKS